MSKPLNAFPGYEYVWSDSDRKYHNMFRGTDVGMGGYVYAEPGIYGNVALLDVASMHPNSIISMNYFGEYTQNYKDLLDARIAIKHGEYDLARKMLGGRLAPYLDDESKAKELSQATKIALNSCYGLTSANFDNPMRHPMNKNNIVALKGALMMRTLQDEIQERGFVVAHIKTDSIKIPDATPEIIQFVTDFGKRYGYTFEHEATYDRMCLVNDAVYIAKYKSSEECDEMYGYSPGDNKKKGGTWTATGTQFQVPYVFKKLFSKEPIQFEDLCETKSVTSALYLDMNENLRDVSGYTNIKELREKPHDKLTKRESELLDSYVHISNDELDAEIAKGHEYRFIGKVGNFCPIKPGRNGGELVRQATGKNGEIKYASATGAKGYRWLESEVVKDLGKEDDIDRTYYDKLVGSAVDSISQYGDFSWFVSDDPYIPPQYDGNGRPIYYPTEEDIYNCPFDVR